MDAHAVFAAAVDERTDMDTVDPGIGYTPCLSIGDHGIVGDDALAGVRIDDIAYAVAADKSVLERLDNLFLAAGKHIHDTADPKSFVIVAVFLTDDDILRNIDKTPGEVTGVGGTERGIGKTFTRASCRGEVFEYLHALAEVRLDRHFDRFTGGARHKSAHTRKLPDLLDRAAGTGNSHHVDRVEFIEVLLKCGRDILCTGIPHLNDTVASFLIGKQTLAVEIGDGIDLLFGCRSVSFSGGIVIS